MKISVIIPALNDGKSLYATLEDLYAHHLPDEVIVVDGGSSDQTLKIASEWTTVISSPKGRARQMNAGAKMAIGEIFLFLHSHTRLPARGLSQIRDAMEKGASAGRFTMRFDHSHWLLRLFAHYTRLPCFSYGDQGFFVRRDVFQYLSGFREDTPFEDVDFYKRLSRVTHPVILKDPVVTSAQRFFEGSGKREKWLHFLLAGLYYMGFKMSRLKPKPHTF